MILCISLTDTHSLSIYLYDRIAVGDEKCPITVEPVLEVAQAKVDEIYQENPDLNMYVHTLILLSLSLSISHIYLCFPSHVI